MPNGPHPIPNKILSRKRLIETWNKSRDASSKPAKPGIDGQTASNFGLKLDGNIAQIRAELASGKFHFRDLKPVTLVKDNGKLRIICVPTVRDRLVQKAIVTWLVGTKRIPQQDFVYGIKGRATRAALARALELRKTFEWCVKTDIQKFFDNVRRDKLKVLVERYFRQSSLVPLLLNAIDREARPRTTQQRDDIFSAGIRAGIGIRQGMPLSPLLANLSLASFDTACSTHNIRILRYADDILGFFHDKSEAQAGFEVIKKALSRLELSVPEIGSAKTELIAYREPVAFLGREIVYLDSVGQYVCRIGRKKIDAIKGKLMKEYALQAVMKDAGTMSEAIEALAASIRSYFGAYKNAQNYPFFESELKSQFKEIMNSWFVELFGSTAIDRLSDSQKEFLGIQIRTNLDPVEDVEFTA
jgi:RNA-directed DNA polymerase